MGTSPSRPRVFSLLPAAAVALPLAFGPWFSDAYGMPKLAVAAAVSALGLLLLLRGGELFSLGSQAELPLLALAAAVALSFALSVDRSLSLSGERLDPLFSVAGLCGCAAAFFMGLSESRRGASRLVRWAAAGSLPVSGYALLQAAGLEPFGLRPAEGALFWQPSPIAGRVVSTFGAPVYLGFYLAAIAPLALHQALDARASRAWRVAGSAALAALVPALALTGSRGAWLAAGVSCLTLLWFRAGPRSRWLALAIVLAAGGLVLRARPRSARSDSDSLRWRAWRAAAATFRARPWIGSGIGTFGLDYALRQEASPAPSHEYPANAHDDALEALATTGVLGLAAYAWFNAAAGRAAFSALSSGGSEAALGAALVSGFVAAKFNPPSLAPAWLLSAFAGCLLGRAPAEGHRTLSAALGALALLCAGVFAWQAWAWTRADRQDLLGRLDRAAGRPREAAVHFERALANRPAAAAYVQDLGNLLWDAAASLPAAERRPLVLRAAVAAREALRLRPADAQLWRLLSEAESRQAKMCADKGALGRAAEASEQARRLDPGFQTVPGFNFFNFSDEKLKKLKPGTEK